jgi:hypothetical protein
MLLSVPYWVRYSFGFSMHALQLGAWLAALASRFHCLGFRKKGWRPWSRASPDQPELRAQFPDYLEALSGGWCCLCMRGDVCLYCFYVLRLLLQGFGMPTLCLIVDEMRRVP